MPRPAMASYIGSKCLAQSGIPLTGFGRTTPATRPRPWARSASRAAAAGSCNGSKAVPPSRGPVRRRELRDPVVPDLVAGDRELDVLEAAEGLAETRVEHGDVDALG